MSKLILLLTLTIVLTARESYGQIKKLVAENGADAKDEQLEAAVWYICSAASVGSIKRKFKTQDEIDAYNTLCPERLEISDP